MSKVVRFTLTAMCAAVLAVPTVALAQDWIGTGGNGMSITILTPQAKGLPENQSHLPALIQGELISNFSNYSAISVLDWEEREAILVRLLSGSYSDSVAESAAQEVGNAIPTTHFMQERLMKTPTGYNLQIRIVQTSDKTTVASFSGNFTYDELNNLTGIRRASLELLPKMGVTLTAKAQEELAGAAAQNHITAQTALAQGVTAQRRGTEVAALSYYFKAAASDPSLLEAVNRSSVLNANISSGNMGDNIRNEIQWRKQWVDRLTETEQFFYEFLKTESMPYTLSYLDAIHQEDINFQNETVTLSIYTYLAGNENWPHPIERTLRAVWDGLNATGKKDSWQLGRWPQQGVGIKDVFATRKNDFSVVFELVNSQNKVIGRQTLQTGGSWGLSGSGRPSVNVSDASVKTVSFQNVNANDITDNLTIRVASVNGINAETVARNGVLQIRAVSRGSFTDSRDGKSYRTVRIGTLTWMAENLDYQTNNSLCYGNNTSNCAKYGRLYTWDAARSACPVGWRLPTDNDWNNLVRVAGGNVAGKKLKSETGWSGKGNGTDEFGFSALPGGRRWGVSFISAGYRGNWWSATEIDASSFAWFRNMGHNGDGVDRGYSNKSFLFSLRCVRDVRP
ncbi:MAG: fibrobacter succinogenes major paralogous domain-containing protein [Chitinispirillia bacterium]|nr:fibrobacter succinogenes major paralogous domain-containing protein [Chitinispirillia bacterium]MCL2268568.1 fibrobacter succinogenes major paralogous domain-containing protein [Chitinispirillia bacterium]